MGSNKQYTSGSTLKTIMHTLILIFIILVVAIFLIAVITVYCVFLMKRMRKVQTSKQFSSKNSEQYGDDVMETKKEMVQNKPTFLPNTNGEVSVCINECLTCSLIQMGSSLAYGDNSCPQCGASTTVRFT